MEWGRAVGHLGGWVAAVGRGGSVLLGDRAERS